MIKQVSPRIVCEQVIDAVGGWKRNPLLKIHWNNGGLKGGVITAVRVKNSAGKSDAGGIGRKLRARLVRLKPGQKEQIREPKAKPWSRHVTSIRVSFLVRGQIRRVFHF